MYQCRQGSESGGTPTYQYAILDNNKKAQFFFRLPCFFALGSSLSNTYKCFCPVVAGKYKRIAPPYSLCVIKGD